MDNKVNRFFKINNINTDDIKYVIHENKKTAVFLIEGKSIETWIPMKDIYENLPKNDFLNIQKRNIGKRKANCKYILQRNLYNDRRSYFSRQKTRFK